MSYEEICHILHITDGTSGDTIGVIEIEAFDLSEFTQQFDVPTQWDPEMLDTYVVGPDDVPFLERFLTSQVTFDFATHGYTIEAVTK